MSENESVSLWIDALKQGDHEAARRLWQRYADRIIDAARRKLGNAPRRIADEDDVAVSVFASLCRGAEAGRFTRLKNRGDLWALLLTITAQKSVDQIRRQTRQKRGGGQVRGDSVFGASDGRTAPQGIDQIVSDTPTPEFLTQMEEEYARLLAELRDETLRKIVQWKMEGHTNSDIADKLGVSVYAVGRKLRMIRLAWSTELTS